MAERKECQKYTNCGLRKELVGCPLGCIRYRHKDEVRVVRCKDCKHWHDETEHYVICSVMEGFMKRDDFCSYGERKDDV